MTDTARVPDLNELTLGSGARLEELIDRESLGELVGTFHELFRLPVRVFGDDAGLLAEVAPEPEIYRCLRQSATGRALVAGVVAKVKSALSNGEREAVVQCVTGAEYRVCVITNDGRRVGRFVLGPFLAPGVVNVPEGLLDQVGGQDANTLAGTLAQLPRSKSEQVAQVSEHLRTTLELILYSGHRALLTSSVHLASVRESFRDAQEKSRSLQAAFDRLKELDDLKNNFLATVSHELRTPLTSIIGYSEMLVEGMAGALNQEQHDFTSTIYEKGTQLLELITALLDISKLESGNLSIVRANLDVGALIRDVAQTVAPMLKKRELRLAIELESGLPALCGDESRLRQVVVNLTDNAMKFAPAGSVITLSARRSQIEVAPESKEGVVLFAAEQPAVQLLVADTGKGISDKEKPKVFDSFYQVDSGTTRAAEGTGLGLSIVQRLVQAHQGRVHIEDNEPTGAVFVVTLPLKRVSVG